MKKPNFSCWHFLLFAIISAGITILITSIYPTSIEILSLIVAFVSALNSFVSFLLFIYFSHRVAHHESWSRWIDSQNDWSSPTVDAMSAYFLGDKIDNRAFYPSLFE